MCITPVLKHLHWFPIRQRKLLSTNFFCMSTDHFPVKGRATCLTLCTAVHPGQISAFSC